MFKNLLTTLLILTTVIPPGAMASKIQQQGIVGTSDCSARGVSNSSCLPLSSQIWDSTLNTTLASAISGGLIGGGGGGGIQLLSNPGFEIGSSATGWIFSSVTQSTQTSTVYNQAQAEELSASSQTPVMYQDVTPSPANYSGVNMEYSCHVLTTATTAEVCARQGGSVIGSCTSVPSTGRWQYVAVNYPGPASGSQGVEVTTTGSTTGAIYVDDCYAGPARNLSQVSQAQLIGQVKITGCSGAWTTNSPSLAAFSVQTSCVYTTSGQASAPSTMIPGITFSSLAPGNYTLRYEGGTQVGGSGGAVSGTSYQFWDGTNSASEVSSVGLNSGGGEVNGFQNTINYSSPQSNVTFSIRASVTNTSYPAQLYGTTAQPGVISVYYFPTQSQLAVNPNQLSAPQTTVITSGGCTPSSSCSGGNYLVPNGATYLDVEAVGGGAGGGGGGTSGTVTNGGSGTATTFGSSLITANGGTGSCTGLTNGGTASLGSGASGIAQNGANGSGFMANNSINEFATGGAGGVSPFGGNGGGAPNTAGASAAANSGSGGGGGGATNTATLTYGCAGGGSGGFVHASIANSSSAWSSSFAYTIGSGGTHGSAGTSGSAGGDGASGQIIVTAYFSNNMPILVGGVTSSGAGQYHTETAQFGASLGGSPCTGTCSIFGNDTSWLSSVVRNSAGNYTLNFAAGVFSAYPDCVSSGSAASSESVCFLSGTPTSTTWPILCEHNGSTIDTYAVISCKGPH